MEQIDSMSWRKFSVLFRNLSPYGAVASRVQEMKHKTDDVVTEEEGRSQAAAFFSAVMSTKGTRT